MDSIYLFPRMLFTAVSKNCCALTFRVKQIEAHLILDCLNFRLFQTEGEGLQSFETSVTFYQSTRRNIPEDLDLQQYRCGNLTYRTDKFS